MKLRLTLILLAAAATFLSWGCSDKKPTASNPADSTGTNTTVWNSAGYWDTQIDATSSSHFTYYSFGRKDTVMLTDSQAASDTFWNIAFERSYIILNGGISGPGSVDGINLAVEGNADSTDFTGLTSMGTIINPNWTSDSYNLVIDEWYTYDPNIHNLTPTNYVYIIKDALDNYVKFQIIGIDNPGFPPNMGTITILYIYSGTSPTFTGPPDTLAFDGSGGGPIYVDFSAGAITNPADPRNSTDWDIEFENYEVHQNATIFGSGQTACYEIWQDQTDPTDFNETQTAPTVPQAYFSDAFGSIMTNWYDYDGNTHTLTSKNHVYVIRNSGHYYKLQIITYYREIGGSPVSGWYSFRWAELQ